jgi:pteridine reductase
VLLTGQNALVTGGAVRIGRAVVEALAAEGCGVAIHARRSRAEGERLVATLRAGGGRAWLVEGELTDPGQRAAMLDAAWECSGGLDILVNSAAVFTKQTVRDALPADYRQAFEVNTWAPADLTRLFARRLSGAPRSVPARVVNLLDRRVAGDDPSCVPYLLSKKALAEFTRLAALEYAPDLVVNAVAPGAILAPPGEDAATLADRAGVVPLAERGTPEDIARAVLFLVTARAVTGQIVFVDGGQHLVSGRGGAA